MNINIAGNLKRLRKQRGITQEDLANFIGVSFQAVSKWECGDGYPDITILPTLANFFEVTLDELVGMNEIKDANKLDEIKKQRYEISQRSGTIKENVALLRGALKTFPNDYWLLSELAYFLTVSDDDDTEEQRKKNNEESIQISERILEFCTDTEIRNKVQADMCRSLHYIGEKDRAVELAKKLPWLDETRECVLPVVLEGKERTEQQQLNISRFAANLLDTIQQLASQAENDGYYTDEERLTLYQKVITICKTVYEEEDFDFAHIYLCNTYIAMAKLYIKQDHKDEAIKSLQEAAKCVIAYLTQASEIRKSLLVNARKRRVTISCDYAKITIDSIEGEDFQSIRDRDEIKQIIDELANTQRNIFG